MSPNLALHHVFGTFENRGKEGLLNRGFWYTFWYRNSVLSKSQFPYQNHLGVCKIIRSISLWVDKWLMRRGLSEPGRCGELSNFWAFPVSQPKLPRADGGWGRRNCSFEQLDELAHIGTVARHSLDLWIPGKSLKYSSFQFWSFDELIVPLNIRVITTKFLGLVYQVDSTWCWVRVLIVSW